MMDQQVDADPAHQPHATTREPKGKFVKDNMESRYLEVCLPSVRPSFGSWP